MQKLLPLLALACLLLSLTQTDAAPPQTDYCEMLARDIQGIQHSFLTGKHLYYCGGQTDAEWKITENETLGFTHPFFRDGRARGHGITTTPTGRGHDKWGWEFWRKTRVAYGSVLLGENEKTERIETPAPKKMVWRPDRVVCDYVAGDAKITETKWITDDDVLCDKIVADKPVRIEFSGKTYFNKELMGTFDGDPLQQLSISSNASAKFDAELAKKKVFTLRIEEKGRIFVKPAWGIPVVEGDVMYNGMSVLLASNQDFSDTLVLEKQKGGYWKYRFTLNLQPGEPVFLAFTQHDDYAVAAKRLTTTLHDPEKSLATRTATVNGWLNEQIPYFRCSDTNVVKTYYYLWSLYFLYFTSAEEWERYPHTQTAVNNFCGLHCWDTWVYSRMAAHVKDPKAWGEGNVLAWQFMVPFKKPNGYLPDNFGTTWWSPVWMHFEVVTENAWRMYQQSGDKDFLRESYDKIFRKLYWDKGPTGLSFQLSTLDALVAMAQELGRNDDVKHWQAMRPEMENAFSHNFNSERDHLAKKEVRDIVFLYPFFSPGAKDAWTQQVLDKYVMSTEDGGFLGPVALDVRAHGDLENGPFAVSTISTWIVLEGMFRRNCDADAVFCTLSHLRGMTKDFGFPVAPESWDANYKPWGSMYYNWDGAMIPLLLERIAGISYSIPEKKLSVAEHLPPGWSFVHTITPVTIDGKTQWVDVRVERKPTNRGDHKTIVVQGSPWKDVEITPWTENREVLERSEKPVGLTLGERIKPLRLPIWILPQERIFTGACDVTATGLRPGSVVRYTTDGTEPTATSLVFPEKLTLKKTTQLRCRAFFPGTAPSKIYDATFKETQPAKPVALDPKTKQKGLKYKFYYGKWKKLPDFNTLQPLRNGVVKQVTLPEGLPQENFGLQFEGYFYAEETGMYYFKLRANDSAKLYVADKNVVSLDYGQRGRDPVANTQPIALEKGWHKIRVDYVQMIDTKYLGLQVGRTPQTLKPVGGLVH